MTVLYKIPRAPCPRGSTAHRRRLVRGCCPLSTPILYHKFMVFEYLKRIKTTKITQLIIFVTIAHITIYFGGLALSTINNYDNAIIAEKIKKECARQNITLKTMLQELNISINAIQQMRKNDKTPNYKYIARICDYLNISMDALLDRAAPAEPEPSPPDLNTAISTVAAAANLSADYVRGVLRLPPTRSSSTDNDI